MALVAAFLSKLHPISPFPDAGLYIWGLFSSLCLLGASATLFPHLCGRVARRPEELDFSRTSAILGVRIVHGHHPLCGEFREHEFAVNGKTFCAGCVGLLVGTSTALFIATIHFVLDFTFPAAVASIGLGFVVLGLLHVPLLRTTPPLLRSALNTVLVSGFALVLVGVDEIDSLGFSLIVVGLCVFWMFTRIQLSSWDHGRVCRGCGYRCGGKEG